jgi:serine/threonine-protein kinase
MADIHINVGIVALARGFITLETFARRMDTLAKQGRALSVRDLWVGDGGLDEAQLATVFDAMGPTTGRDTMLFVAEPPKAEPVIPPSPVTQPGRVSAGLKKLELLNVQVGTATAPTDASLDMSSLGGVPRHVSGQITVPLTATPQHQDLVGARYKRMFQLGAGGLGEVSACEDLVLGRTVAVKAGHQSGDVDSYSSKVILAREARIISALEHPNIIPIYDAGTDPVRGPFYVMRQVTDTSLEVILRRRRLGEGDPRDYTLGRLLRYFLQVCNAVDYAHHRGVIHCDIKPANILLGEYGEVLLVDWGLAQSRQHPLGVRGGTLGYMAPEQMDVAVERFDERTDVFALGAILYEILAGQQAFPDMRTSSLDSRDLHSEVQHRLKQYQLPAPPSALRPELEIQEIEEICMRALALDREQRLASARLLADAIDEFIEGSKQKERKRLEADASADAGDELAERYHEFIESRPEKLTVFRALRADVVPWAHPDDKQELWDAEDIIRVTDALTVRTFHSAVSAYERALDAVPKHARARRGLARLYMSELKRARRRGDALAEIEYEQLLREVDDGELSRELSRDGTLELAIAPAAQRVTLSKLVERDRRIVEGTALVIANRPAHTEALPVGRYVVRAAFCDATDTVAWPIVVEAGATCAVDLALPVERLGENEVLVPRGPARLQGDPLSTESDEPIVVDLDTFVIQKYPVTFAQWFAFLDALRAQDPASAEAHVPRTALGLPAWQYSRTQRNWVSTTSLPAIVLPTASEHDPATLPLFGVSAESAEAYARWLAEVEGKKWRLPTEHEWEKAGRGTDGRIYPWGDQFDATFCKMRDSRPGLPLAEALGAFPSDSSPYGVRDMGGGVADWCTPDPRRTAPREPREVVSRGGAWCDWPIDCRLASRRRYLAFEHSARVGVRLARDP